MAGMQRLSALVRALESFGFDEQSSVCRRLCDSGTIAFKDDSTLWQQWAVNAQERGEKPLGFEEYDSWMRSRNAALAAWDEIALPIQPPPLMFDALVVNTPAAGNSLTKARITSLHSRYLR